MIWVNILIIILILGGIQKLRSDTSSECIEVACSDWHIIYWSIISVCSIAISLIWGNDFTKVVFVAVLGIDLYTFIKERSKKIK